MKKSFFIFLIILSLPIVFSCAAPDFSVGVDPVPSKIPLLFSDSSLEDNSLVIIDTLSRSPEALTENCTAVYIYSNKFPYERSLYDPKTMALLCVDEKSVPVQLLCSLSGLFLDTHPEVQKQWDDKESSSMIGEFRYGVALYILHPNLVRNNIPDLHNFFGNLFNKRVS